MIFKHFNPDWLPYLIAMGAGITVALVVTGIAAWTSMSPT
jgi:hypothetical protein